MLKKAFFRSFFFLLFFVLMALPAMASPFYGGGGNLKNTPSDNSHPRFNDLVWFVRRVPVMLYDPTTMDYDPKTNSYSLKNPDLIWGELWTKPEWAQEGNRYGLNELYIPVNSNMTPAPASGTNKVVLPDAGFDDPTTLKFFADNGIDISTQTRVIDKNNTWAGDASSGVFVNIPMPTREGFLAQDAGMNDAQAAKWKPYLASKGPNAVDGFIPSADISDSGKKYLRALDAFDHGATFYYHLLLNAGPQTENWHVAAQTSPYYDENAPEGTGFYRGKDWSDQLKSSPAAVPGFIGVIKPWANLKIEGPTEITGIPGEEKEAQYTVTNESGADLTPEVGTKRDGTYAKAADVPVKAWNKAPVTIKFKVEDQPYTVRVEIPPNQGIFESTYKDNYVDVVVKPIAPDMYVKVLDPGTSEETPGSSYSGTVVFGLASDYSQPVQGVLSLTNNGYPVQGIDGQTVEFKPGDEKIFTFTWHGNDGGDKLVAKIHPVNPPDDKDWSNNTKEAYVPEKVAQQSSGGSGNLILQAHSRGGQDIRGNYVPPEDRSVNTAKYADVVKAVLKIYQPSLPQSLQRVGAVIDWWRVDSATVSYPKRAPDFTFSHFVDPVGTVTVNMSYPGGQIENVGSVEATAEFEEDWSVAGAPIHDMLTDRDAPPPTEYPITAAYKTTVHYHYYVSEEGDSKPTRVDGEISVNGNVTANLLVNGTGINIL